MSKIKHMWSDTGKECDSNIPESDILVLKRYGIVRSVETCQLTGTCQHGIGIGNTCWKCERLNDWLVGKLQMSNLEGIWEDWPQYRNKPTFSAGEYRYRRKPEPTTRFVEWPVVEEGGILICKTHNGRAIGRANKAECQVGFRGWKFDYYNQPSASLWFYTSRGPIHAKAALMEVKI